MKLESIELKCMDCGKKFSAPAFGDFDYGLFVFSGEKGGVFGYFRALENPVWKFIDTIFEKRGSGRDKEIEHGERLQAACAHFADAIKGQRLKNYDVCPRCYSCNLEYGRRLNDVFEVPEVSHAEFLSVPDPIRRQQILEFERSYTP